MKCPEEEHPLTQKACCWLLRFMRGGEIREWVPMGTRFPFGSDGDVLEVQSGDGCTKFQIC